MKNTTTLCATFCRADEMVTVTESFRLRRAWTDDSGASVSEEGKGLTWAIETESPKKKKKLEKVFDKQTFDIFW